MSTTEMIDELAAMPEEKQRETVKAILARLYPEGQKTVERMLRRIENPDIPEDVWRGFEEAEDGMGIEICDEHFLKPPA